MRPFASYPVGMRRSDWRVDAGTDTSGGLDTLCGGPYQPGRACAQLPPEVRSRALYSGWGRRDTPAGAECPAG